MERVCKIQIPVRASPYLLYFKNLSLRIVTVYIRIRLFNLRTHVVLAFGVSCRKILHIFIEHHYLDLIPVKYIFQTQLFVLHDNSHHIDLLRHCGKHSPGSYGVWCFCFTNCARSLRGLVPWNGCPHTSL